jgi:hypothetical protein
MMSSNVDPHDYLLIANENSFSLNPRLLGCLLGSSKVEGSSVWIFYLKTIKTTRALEENFLKRKREERSLGIGDLK